MHVTQCYVRLLEYAENAGDNGSLDLAALRQKLLVDVCSSITRDTSVWETAYICKPSLFFNSRDSIFYADNRDIAEYECDTIERTQQRDGSWAVTWGWAEYPDEWAITKNWWKSQIAISNLLFLKGMGRL
jgi:hypothetical protein